MRGKRMYVYILASLSRTLYTVVTNNIERRMYEHRNKLTPGFATSYRINRLVYFEVVYGPMNAIRREKQIKAWTREKRMALVESTNAGWLDLARDWFRETLSPSTIPPNRRTPARHPEGAQRPRSLSGRDGNSSTDARARR